MAMDDKITWLKDYFARSQPLPDAVEDANFYDRGMIDSFGVIDLVETIEQEFGVRFEQSHFTDRRFSTIRGLAEIIDELERQMPDRVQA